MTERRPHWSDDLIDAVIDAIPLEYIVRWGKITGPGTYPVIAAVEDWQKKRWASITQSPMEVAVQFNALEAAIARVREVCDRADNNGEWPGMLVRVSAVRKALEGDSDDH